MAAVTWTQTRITIAGSEGPAPDREAWIPSVCPHLAITRIPYPELAAGADTWSVTHVPSGRSIAKWFQLRAAAEALLLLVTPYGDWSLGVNAIVANRELITLLWTARAAIYAAEERGDYGPVDYKVLSLWNTRGTRLEETQPTLELGQKMRARFAHR